MEWSLVVLIGMGMVSFLIFMSFVMKAATKEKELKLKKENSQKEKLFLENSAKELMQAMKVHEERQVEMMKRLENLETIVTSETWEAVGGEDLKKTIELPLTMDEPAEQNDAEKAAHIAKRVR